jgi:hypothetical protein
VLRACKCTNGSTANPPGGPPHNAAYLAHVGDGRLGEVAAHVALAALRHAQQNHAIAAPHLQHALGLQPGAKTDRSPPNCMPPTNGLAFIY